MTVRGLVLGGIAAASTARAAPAADPEPDPAVDQARQANLEPSGGRSGVVVAVAGGNGVIVGLGINDSVGAAGALSLRLGHVATPSVVATFEISVIASLHRPSTTADPIPNTDVNLAVGGQYYVNPSLWLRGAGGVGIYRARQVPGPSGLEDRSLVGPVAVWGIGLELVRFHWAVLGVEIGASAMVNREGVLITTGAAAGLAFD